MPRAPADGAAPAAGDAVTSDGRVPQVDAARGLALVGMAIYHFAFDLQMFGHLDPGTVQSGGWRFLARLVAGSFLFLAGLSLWLGHGQGVRWPAFLRRLGMIVVAALAVTIATYLAVPGAFVRFGILHAIAAASILSLPFLRLPGLVAVAVGLVVLALPLTGRAPVFDAVPWLGLATRIPPMVDFVPILPWLAPALFGVAAGKLASRLGLWARLAHLRLGRSGRTLALAGRHSLAIYLVHQPALVALVWAASRIPG